MPIAMPAVMPLFPFSALVIHRCIAPATVISWTGRLHVTAAMMPPPAGMAIVNRLRHPIHGLLLVINRLRLYVNRLRLNIDRLRLNIDRLGLNVNRLGLIDRAQIAHIHHSTGGTHAYGPIHIVPGLNCTGKTHRSNRQSSCSTRQNGRAVCLDGCLHHVLLKRAESAHTVIKRTTRLIAYRTHR